MRDLQARRKFRRMLYSRASILLLSAVALFLAHSVWGVYKIAKLAKINELESLAKLTDLEKRKNDLTNKVEKMKTERGVEEELRQKFQVVKPGEQILVIVDNKKNDESEKTDQIFWIKQALNTLIDLFK